MLGGAFLITSTKVFADDGGWKESGGTFGSWAKTEGAWEAIKRAFQPVLGAFSIGLGFVPVFGDIKDGQEALTGIDLVTGEKLSIGDRFITGVAMFVPVVNGKALREGIGLAADGAEIIARHGDEAVDIVRHGDDILDSTRAGEKAIDGYESAEKIAKNTTTDAVDIPPAFRQNEFASSYEARICQTPAETNLKVGFEGARGDSLCTLKPPPDTQVKKVLDEAGSDGIQYRNGVPDFSPTAKAQVEIDHMLGGTGLKNVNKARVENFAQADVKLAEQLNNSSELANKFGMKSGEITKTDIVEYRKANNLTWHELN